MQTATAYEDVIQKAVKKGKGVKREVLEEIKIEKEIEKEHEIDKEVEKRIRNGELSKVEYPYSDDANPITMVRNPEDEVYGNLPMSFKVDISDAVNFIEAWDNAKPTDMRAAFLQSHLTNKVKDEYFDELRKRLEVAKRQGHSQIIMPTPNQEMVEEMGDSKTKEEKGSNDDLAATLAPLITLQKIMGEDSPKEPQEKPTDIVKTIMETAKDISKGRETQEKPTDVVKGILEAAKELSTSKGGGIDPIELTNTIIAAAGALAQSKEPTTQQSPDMIQQIAAVSELVNTLSNKSNGGNSEGKIQVPRDDGTIMEMTVQQYMLSELLQTKLANTQQAPQHQEQKTQSDTIQIQDPDGTVRTMPAATYISELALKRISENKEQEPKRTSETERVSQDNTKLMAALVATVERLSTDVSHIKAEGKNSDPMNMLSAILEQGAKIDNFRHQFLGGGLTEEDKKREAEEQEKQREHELKLAQMQTKQANRSALTNILSQGDGIVHQDRMLPTTEQQQPPMQEPPGKKEHEKEAIRQSQRKAEQMIEDLAREKALAERIREEGIRTPKVGKHVTTRAQESQPQVTVKANAKAEGNESKGNVEVKEGRLKVKEKGGK